jgi:hypothetical protein
MFWISDIQFCCSLFRGLIQPQAKMSTKNPPGEKRGRSVWLITSLTVVRRLSRKCGILNISQSYRAPRPVTGIVLLLFYFFQNSCISDNLEMWIHEELTASSQARSNLISGIFWRLSGRALILHGSSPLHHSRTQATVQYSPVSGLVRAGATKFSVNWPKACRMFRKMATSL